MKTKSIFILSTLPLFLLVSCGKNNTNSVTYSEKEVNIYRRKNVVDRKISLRFFEDSPNVPYISVLKYFKEFYSSELTKSVNKHKYTYRNDAQRFLQFDIDKQEFSSDYLDSFSRHPDFIENNYSLFLKTKSIEITQPKVKTVSLNKYSIQIYQDNGEAYVPLSFLSAITGGTQLYDIAYNGKDIYVIDWNGQLGVATSPSYYGATYWEMLKNINEKRPQDLANYSYNELCFVFDNLRGETKQLYMGEENLNSLGLDGVLSRDYPKTKEFLLSTDKQDYYEGYNSLFITLSDGGHTGIPGAAKFEALNTAARKESEEEFKTLIDYSETEYSKDEGVYISYYICKMQSLDVTGNYYKYDETTKTALIGFDEFAIDYEGWDNYYNQDGEVPVSTDSYAFVRDSVYKAKVDGAVNLVLDLTTNTGGSSYALEGIMSLFNNAEGYIKMKDTFNECTNKETHLIDINLDGKFDEADVNETKSFNFNVAVMTSCVSFSCGNLLPFTMKELGYKIIGEQSGGGSCAISLQTTGDGLGYIHSSHLCLTDEKGENIDGGVPVDYEIERQSTTSSTLYYCYDFYDFDIVSNIVNELYSD